MSEYGYQSFPLLPTIERFTEEDDRHLGSPVMLAHQKHSRGTAIITNAMVAEYGEANDFESFCYLSQLQQADGLRVAFDAHRRAMPFCMGSLYWQLNDCWPCASWSSIDYFGNWKALHYQARRSFATVALSVVEDAESETYTVHAVSDALERTVANLRVALVGLDGTILFEGTEPVAIDANSSANIYSVGKAQFPAGFRPDSCVFTAELTGYPETRIVHYLVRQGELALEDPHVRIQVSPDGDSTRIDISCASYARGVCLMLNDGEAAPPGMAENFSDNFFDLVPGEVRSISIARPDVSNAQISVRSLYSALKPR